MFVDRSVRLLGLLNGASTSRVFNLAGIADKHGSETAYRDAPLFAAPVLNRSILVKHRVEPHEQFLFCGHTDVATKIVIPDDPLNLPAGAHSFFVEQRGFKSRLKEVGRYRNGEIERDLQILQRFDSCRSFDPLLLREMLRRDGIEAADCYFEFSAAECTEMKEFAAGDILAFIGAIMGQEVSVDDPGAARLMTALLEEEVGDKLDPLRRTLTLDSAQFRDGLFAWRAFLYYKWLLHASAAKIHVVLSELQQTRSKGGSATTLGKLNKRVSYLAHCAMEDACELVQVYDDALAEFTQQRRPSAFRRFLLEAPSLLPELAERMGALTHVIALWSLRFPAGPARTLEAHELLLILDDFEAALAPASPHALAMDRRQTTELLPFLSPA
jgi:hypothetical protein